MPGLPVRRRIREAALTAWFTATEDPASAILMVWIVLCLVAAFRCAPEDPRL